MKLPADVLDGMKQTLAQTPKMQGFLMLDYEGEMKIFFRKGHELKEIATLAEAKDDLDMTLLADLLKRANRTLTFCF